MAGRTTLSINRAPVLTLWAAVVAERLGFDRDEALTLGRAVAGLNAQSKGRRIGVFRPHEERPKTARRKDHGERFLVEVCGRDVPAVNTPDGLRAVSGGKPIDPGGSRSTWRVPSATTWRPSGPRCGGWLAGTPRRTSQGPPTLSTSSSAPRFRPGSGGGAKGVLDLGLIGRLAAGPGEAGE